MGRVSSDVIGPIEIDYIEEVKWGTEWDGHGLLNLG